MACGFDHGLFDVDDLHRLHVGMLQRGAGGDAAPAGQARHRAVILGAVDGLV